MRRAWIAASVALIVAATLWPFTSTFTDLAAAPWCIRCSDVWLADAFSNVALFVPLGVSLAAAGRRAGVAGLVGLGISLVVELLQSAGIPPGRSPSVVDLLTNGTGTLLGAALFHARLRLFRPSGTEALRMVSAWTVVAAGTILVTSAAESPESGTPAKQFRSSRFEYSPGYGWYGGAPTSASVNSTRFTHQGTGPIVVEALGTLDTLRLELVVIGKDTATYPRSALYVHESGDTSARTLILQHGTAARLVARRRASGWGLNLPPLEVAGAFADPSPTATRRLIARSARDSLTLAWCSNSQSGRATLALTPLLGWAIIQSLVAPGSWSGRVLQGLWIMLLFAPIGWWAAHSHHPLLTLSLAATALVSATAAAPALFGVAAVGLLNWSLMAGALAGGFLLARARIVRRHAGILPP